MINYIKQVVLDVLKGDSQNYPSAGVSYKGKSTDVVRQSVYGVSSNPPAGSNGLLFQVDCTNSIKYAIFDYMTGRFKNLEAGEVQVGNYLTAASIKFDKDGNVIIDVPDGNLTATVSGNSTINTTDFTVNATGNSLINGNLNVNGDVTANNFISTGISVDFNTHIHTGDDGGDTGPPK